MASHEIETLSCTLTTPVDHEVESKTVFPAIDFVPYFDVKDLNRVNGCLKRAQQSDRQVSLLVSWLVFWAQSSTSDYIRADDRLHTKGNFEKLHPEHKGMAL